jgi:hypothetical protein
MKNTTPGTILFLAVAAAVLPAGLAPAATVVVAEGGSQAQLQAAVDALGGPGVILVPPGSWEFDGTVSVSQSNVTLLGSGETRSLLRRTHEEDSSFIAVRDASWVRVSGLGIEGNGDAASTSSEYGISLTNVTDFRVDHCAFAHLGFAGVRTGEATTGVVDHCSFVDIYKPAIANLGYGVVIYGIGTVEDVPYGSPLATFAEDSFFSGCRHASASNAGARYVFRYNHVTANVVSHAIDTHGHEYTTAENGTEWCEVYGNLVDAPVDSYPGVGIRGGTGLVWGNTFNDYATAVRLTEQTDQDTGPVYVWDNTLSPSGGTMVALVTSSAPLPPADGVPEAVEEPFPGYTAYTYPHPLVTDLAAAAGPDMTVIDTDGSGQAEVFVDGSGSTAAPGSIVAYRWYLGGTPVSECMMDILEVPPGLHLLLLEVERDDGLEEHDLAVVEVLEAGPLVSSTAWASHWFPPIAATGIIRFTLTPSLAGMNGYAAVTGRHAVDAHEDNAVIIRAGGEGRFDAYNGDAYEAVATIPYEAGVAYDVEITVDVAAGRYSATVNGTLRADGYAFRLAEPSLGQLVAWHDTGGLGLTDIVVEGSVTKPSEGCIEDLLPEEPPIEDIIEAEADTGETPDAPADGGDADPGPDATGDPAADPSPEGGGGASGGCSCSLAGI